jgi:hypothetical protein
MINNGLSQPHYSMNILVAWSLPAWFPSPVTLVIAIIVLLFIGYFAWITWLKGPTNKIGISNVVLSITPTTLPPGSPQRFTATVTAFGYSDTPVPRDFTCELIDHDPLNNDVLDEFKSNPAAGVGGLAMLSPTPPSPLYSWTLTHTFQLWCNTSCNVEGPKGSSGESDPKIFARFNIKYGTPEPSMDSTPVIIRCVAPGQ